MEQYTIESMVYSKYGIDQARPPCCLYTTELKKEWRKSLNKNGRDQILWTRETEHPLTQIPVFTKTAGRHNLLEVSVI